MKYLWFTLKETFRALFPAFYLMMPLGFFIGNVMQDKVPSLGAIGLMFAIMVGVHFLVWAILFLLLRKRYDACL